MGVRFFWQGKNILDPDIKAVTGEVVDYAIERIAINRAIELHANVISACEFKWYTKGKLINNNEGYYLLNIRPNKNETATAFWHKAICTLFRNGEVLIFQSKVDKELFVADSFEVEKSLYYNDTYKNIISREVGIKDQFLSDDVIYLKLDDKIHQVISSHFSKLGDIVNYAVESYRQSNGTKLAFNIGTSSSRRGIGNEPDDELKNKTQDYIEKLLKSFFNSFNSITPLQQGEELKEVASKTGKPIDEIAKSFNTIFETIAISFGIPVDIFMGKATEKSNALNDWVTLKLKYLFEQLSDSMNHAIIKKNDYLKGDRIIIDTTKINHKDLLDSANNIDKLHSNGITLNEIFDRFNLPPDKDDQNADKRFFTKNQEKSSDVEKGGE